MNIRGQTTTEFALGMLLCLLLALVLNMFFEHREGNSLTLSEGAFYNVEYTVTKAYP
jgi:hypothetical protein